LGTCRSRRLLPSRQSYTVWLGTHCNAAHTRLFLQLVFLELICKILFASRSGWTRPRTSKLVDDSSLRWSNTSHPEEKVTWHGPQLNASFNILKASIGRRRSVGGYCNGIDDFFAAAVLYGHCCLNAATVQDCPVVNETHQDCIKIGIARARYPTDICLAHLESMPRLEKEANGVAMDLAAFTSGSSLMTVLCKFDDCPMLWPVGNVLGSVFPQCIDPIYAFSL
jgi:hypothetical protein